MGQYASAEGMEKPRRQAAGRVIRRGEGGVDRWGGPLWSPAWPLFRQGQSMEHERVRCPTSGRP